ncbi:unnamed protein product [Schistosoma turkestanicum]|nr:unnamed protein product [Schistosoma turkestanicum]
MYRYIGTYVCLLSILITCNLNFIFQHGKSNFATANVLFSAPQLSVVTGLKAHALFLTIHVHPSASPRTCFKSIMKIREYVKQIHFNYESKITHEILYGVGFGFNFFRNISPATRHREFENFEYRERIGGLGKLPNTGGDILVHAKSDDRGMLFELAKLIIFGMPSECVAKFEDIYSFLYRGGRDLGGFVDGTENPKRLRERVDVAVNKRTGGSYAVAQRWVHNMTLLHKTGYSTLEQWIGRTIKDSIELQNKPDTSHVARMVGSDKFQAKKKYRIVRQAQPYGSLSKEAGLFFIAYAEDVKNFNFMLDRMTGHADDNKTDRIMMFTRCVTGNYYYFPDIIELNHLIRGHRHRYVINV